MKFVDETSITVISGKGGDGLVSFRRERNLPFGGPDGGDGGNGGDIILRASINVDTLLSLARTGKYRAENGEKGGGNNRRGATAKNIIIEVPLGTTIFDGEHLIADLTENNQEFIVVHGGVGGYGNRRYANSQNQVPTEFTYGGDSEQKKLSLELKLIADVGLIGFPNAGKSTLLARMSAARPKIADYPFTTLQPQLGIVSSGYGRELVMADIPGIIAGAAEGRGMGHEFLRHVERCRVLIHLLDLVPLDGSSPINNYHTINRELHAFSEKLASKPQIVVGNKLDLTGAAESLNELQQQINDAKILSISAATGIGLDKLRAQLFTAAQK